MKSDRRSLIDFFALAAPGVRALDPYQPGKPLAELAREYGITDAVKLASNENPLGPGPCARASIRAGCADIGRYPDGGGYALKKALAARLAIGSDRITLGNGSNDVLELAARSFVTSSHQVIFSQHAFAVYALATQAIGAEAVVTAARDYGHDLGAMRAAINARTGLIFIANPNNPTGTWIDEPELLEFIQCVPPRVVIVLDEAYFEYVQAPGYPNGLRLIDRFPNLVVTRTFSKIHGLAGLRVGYAVSHPQVAELMNRVRQPFNVNSVALAAAEAALADEEHVTASVAVNKAGLAQLTRACEALGLGYIPSAANFLCIELGYPAHDLYEALLRRGVIVRPIANYGLPNHLRITVGTEPENTRFIDALRKVLNERS